MEGTTLAAPGTGVQVPTGDSLAESPSIRKRGPPRRAPEQQGFKREYAQGEEAPIAVISTRPKVRRRVLAEYSDRMRELGIEGRVVLELTIDGRGKVAEVKLVSGLHEELDRAAIAAARQMEFEPATVDGRPVRVRIPYTFTFVLD
jgi:TonB family protein